MARKSKYEHLKKPSSVCNRCGQSLSSKDSRARGYGADCWKKVRGVTAQSGESPDRMGRTVSVPWEAEAVMQEIRKRVGHAERKACTCGKPLLPEQTRTYDHSGGYALRGFGEKQWVYVHCSCGHDTSYQKLGAPSLEDLEKRSGQ